MASPARHLALVELDDQGEITGRVDSDALKTLEARAEKAETNFKLAEKDLAAKRRQIAELTRDKARERLDHPDRDFIVRVCRYWAAKCRPGNNRIDPLAPNRFDAVAALAEMQKIEMVEVDGKRKRVRCWRYEAQHFKAMVDGGAFDPYVPVLKNGQPDPQNDLEQLARDVTRFERSVRKSPYFTKWDALAEVPGFVRFGPKDVAAGLGNRHNQRSSSKPRSTQPHSLGGTHDGSARVVAYAGRGPLVPVQTRRSLVRRCVGPGLDGLPASVT